MAGSVSFAQDDGTPFAVELASEGEGKIVPLQAVSSVSFSIPPRGTETISTDGLGEVAVAGSATVTADGAVGGVVKFDLSGVGIAGVGATEPLNGFVIPARRAAGGINTGVAIHNSESTPVSLTLRLFDSQGFDVSGGTTSINNLVANGHLAQFIGGGGEVLFPNADTDDFEGTVVVEVTGGRVAAVALELDAAAQQFTTLPVTSLD